MVRHLECERDQLHLSPSGWFKAWAWAQSTRPPRASSIRLAHANYMLYAAGNPWSSPTNTEANRPLHYKLSYFLLLSIPWNFDSGAPEANENAPGQSWSPLGGVNHRGLLYLLLWIPWNFDSGTPEAKANEPGEFWSPLGCVNHWWLSYLLILWNSETWPVYLSSISILTKYQYTDNYT